MVCDEDVLLCSDELNPPQDENTQVSSSTNSKSKKIKLDRETWYRYKNVENWGNWKIKNSFRNINVCCVLYIELLLIVGCSRISAFIFVEYICWIYCVIPQTIKLYNFCNSVLLAMVTGVLQQNCCSGIN